MRISIEIEDSIINLMLFFLHQRLSNLIGQAFSKKRSTGSEEVWEIEGGRVVQVQTGKK